MQAPKLAPMRKGRSLGKGGVDDLEIVLLLDSSPQPFEVLGCEFSRAQILIFLVHPELDVIGCVHQAVTLKNLS